MITTTNNIWRSILLFLSPKEFRSLALTNREFYRISKENEDIIVRQFHSMILANQDMFLCSIYFNKSYTNLVKKEIAWTLPLQDSDSVKKFVLGKRRLSEFLTGFCGPEKGQKFVQTLNDALIKPRLPPLRLKRDTKSCETFSIYQNYLNDVFYGLDDESNPPFYTMFDEEEIFEFSAAEKAKLLTVNPKSKDLILYARWYLQNEVKAAISVDEEQEDNGEVKLIRTLSKKICKMHIDRNTHQKNGKFNSKKAFYEKLSAHNCLSHKERKELAGQAPALVEIYMLLDEIFSAYCDTIYHYLSTIKNPFVFMAEYNAKWKNFVSSMQTIGGFLRHFSAAMNEVYERDFAGHPNHPEFRIWRMMAKTWCNRVFCKLEKVMQPTFIKIVDSYLNAFTSNSNAGNIQMEGIEQIIPSKFLESEHDVSSVISDFWNSILDMALNERTVFSLTCVDLMNFGLAANFSVSLHNLISQRCQSLVDAKNLKPSQKFELISDNIELLAGVIPQHIFPEVFKVGTNALQTVLIQFFTEVDAMTTEQAIQFFEKEVNSHSCLYKFLSSESHEAITIYYPALTEHMRLYSRKLKVISDIVCERERRKEDNIKKGFNPASCEMEKAFLDLDRSVNIYILQQCKAIYC